MAVINSNPYSTSSLTPHRRLFCCLFLCLAPAAALPQTFPEIEEQESSAQPLIFDPVLIEYSPLDDSIELDLDDLIPGTYQVNELSALPSMPAQQIRQDPVEGRLIRDSISTTPAQYQDSILDYELEGGVYDYRLIEAYSGLGSAYQALDEHELAIEAFSQALHVNRVNNGLYNAAQLPIVSELVESYLSLGDFADANQQQEYLIFVEQKVYGPNHPIHIIKLLEYADWNLRAASLRMGYVPNEIALGLRSSPFDDVDIDRRDPDGMQLSVTQLIVASNAYYQALNLQRNRERFTRRLDPEEVASMETEFGFTENDLSIPQAEKKLAYTHFLLAKVYQNIPASMRETDLYYLNFRDGQDALERRFVYLQNSQSPASDVIKALMDIADWLLLFDRWNSAEEVYAEVLSLKNSYALEDIRGLSYRELPEVIPNFVTTPFSRDSYHLSASEPLQYAGYIDVSFELNRFARPNRVDIINASEGTREETEDALINMLRRSSFRLQLQDSDFEYSDNNYLVRYYYTSQAQP